MALKMHLVLCRLNTGINGNAVVNGYMYGRNPRPITIQYANRQGNAIKCTVSGTKSVLSILGLKLYNIEDLNGLTLSRGAEQFENGPTNRCNLICY